MKMNSSFLSSHLIVPADLGYLFTKHQFEEKYGRSPLNISSFLSFKGDEELGFIIFFIFDRWMDWKV